MWSWDVEKFKDYFGDGLALGLTETEADLNDFLEQVEGIAQPSDLLSMAKFYHFQPQLFPWLVAYLFPEAYAIVLSLVLELQHEILVIFESFAGKKTQSLLFQPFFAGDRVFLLGCQQSLHELLLSDVFVHFKAVLLDIDKRLVKFPQRFANHSQVRFFCLFFKQLLLAWIENVFFPCYFAYVQPFFLQKLGELQLLLLFQVVTAKAEVKVRVNYVDVQQVLLKQLVDQILFLYDDRLSFPSVWNKVKLLVLLVLCRNEFAVDRCFSVPFRDSFALLMLKIDDLEDSSVEQSQSKDETEQFVWLSAGQPYQSSLTFALNHAKYFFLIDFNKRLSYMLQQFYISKFTVFIWLLCLKVSIFHIIIDSDIDIGWVNALWVLCL